MPKGHGADVAGSRQTGGVYAVLSRGPGGITLSEFDKDGRPLKPGRTVEHLATEVARLERDRPRWVWDDTSTWYPGLLRAGVRVERCVDLRLCRAILRNSALAAASELAAAPPDAWDKATPDARASSGALFDLDEPESTGGPVEEFARQRRTIAATSDPARIGLLLAAESAGALIAAEMRFAGLPWSSAEHDRMLTVLLGPRPRAGERPTRMLSLLERVRTILGAPDLNPDSPPDLLKALAAAGIPAESSRSWELQKIDHPVIGPLLEYKKLARLLSANGWNWLDANVTGERFHPDFVPGGVVTGRWASKGGGGALQLPKQVRGAVIADPGWKLVVADAAQLEPRILAALSGDRGMIEAGTADDCNLVTVGAASSGGDLYAGIVASGAVDTREHAKVAMLGAMYGATSGEAGRLLPRLARTYPRAIAFVEEAARAGERGETVSTRLGRSSPRGAVTGYDETATEADTSKRRTQSKSWGRFTRNFVVQGTAAEWALCWMAGLRGRLRAFGGDGFLTDEPHLVFFLHDEVVVHCPADRADAVETEIRAAAADAGRLLFGRLPIEFPLTVAIVDNYGEAK